MVEDLVDDIKSHINGWKQHEIRVTRITLVAKATNPLTTILIIEKTRTTGGTEMRESQVSFTNAEKTAARGARFVEENTLKTEDEMTRVSDGIAAKLNVATDGTTDAMANDRTARRISLGPIVIEAAMINNETATTAKGTTVIDPLEAITSMEPRVPGAARLPRGAPPRQKGTPRTKSISRQARLRISTALWNTLRTMTTSLDHPSADTTSTTTSLRLHRQKSRHS